MPHNQLRMSLLHGVDKVCARFLHDKKKKEREQMGKKEQRNNHKTWSMWFWGDCQFWAELHETYNRNYTEIIIITGI